MDKRALYFGHSHTGALFHALEQRRTASISSLVEHVAYNIWRHNLNVHYVVQTKAGPVFNPEVIEEIGGFDKPETTTVCVAMFGGNPHNVLGLLKSEPDYDFAFDPAHPEVEPGLTILATEMIRAQILRATEGFLEQLTVLRTATQNPIINLQSPPPIADEAYILANLDRFFQDENERPRIARASLRRKLWLVHSEIVESHCHVIGIPTLPCPPEALTPEGFLRDEYWANATHANGAYGEHLIRQVEDFVQRLPESVLQPERASPVIALTLAGAGASR